MLTATLQRQRQQEDCFSSVTKQVKTPCTAADSRNLILENFDSWQQQAIAVVLQVSEQSVRRPVPGIALRCDFM